MAIVKLLPKRLPRTCRQEGGLPKLRYGTRSAAKAAVREHTVPMHWYRCPHCGYFHLATA